MRAERDQTSKCKLKWVLEYPNPCECTSVAMGGFNIRRIPERLVAPPGAVESPLVSDDIHAIRKHYGLQCDKEGKFCVFFTFVRKTMVDLQRQLRGSFICDKLFTEGT